MFNLFNFNHKKENGSRGAISLLVALSVLAVIIAIALGSSFIVSSESRLSSDSSDSIVAYYAAETGIEQAMYEHLKGNIQPNALGCSVGWTAFGDASYCLVITQSDPLDHNTVTAIKSIGEYKSTRRSICVSFDAAASCAP